MEFLSSGVGVHGVFVLSVFVCVVDLLQRANCLLSSLSQTHMSRNLAEKPSSTLAIDEVNDIGPPVTVAQRGKTQLNFSSETRQSFREHNNLLNNTTIFFRTQQSFREYNNRFGNTTIFFRIQRNFLIHNNLFQSTIKFSDTQTKTKTQQNFKVLVINSNAATNRNLGLALVTWTLRCPPGLYLVATMFCHNCGGWRRMEHKFCPKCSISLPSSSASQVPSFKKGAIYIGKVQDLRKTYTCGGNRLRFYNQLSEIIGLLQPINHRL